MFGMWLTLQVDEPSDYIFGTGEGHSVEDFARLAFEVVGLDWRDYVIRDRRLGWRQEPDVLVADASKARQELGWRASTSFSDLVELMVKADLQGIR